MAANDTADSRKGPSLVVQIGVLAVLTAGAGAAGWLSGSSISSQRPAAEAAVAAERAAETSTAEMADKLGIVHLDPMTTNLAAPADMWMRLELSLVFDGQPDVTIAKEVHQDLLAYLRTVKAHQIEGASGFRHLKADLAERAAIRSDSAVRDILIRAMLIE